MRLLQRTYDWLAASEPAQKSDVIFVLAGRECRKHYGLRLLEEGLADRVVLSVARFEIRRFSEFKLPLETELLTLAVNTVPERRHYFVELFAGRTHVQQIPLRRFGTWSEILAFAQWVGERKAIQTGMIVSSDFHLRRVRWCCRMAMPARMKLRFIAAPGEDRSLNRDRWWRDSRTRRLVLRELVKVMFYRCFRRPLQSSPASAGE